MLLLYERDVAGARAGDYTCLYRYALRNRRRRRAKTIRIFIVTDVEQFFNGLLTYKSRGIDSLSLPLSLCI